MVRRAKNVLGAPKECCGEPTRWYVLGIEPTLNYCPYRYFVYGTWCCLKVQSHRGAWIDHRMEYPEELKIRVLMCGEEEEHGIT